MFADLPPPPPAVTQAAPERPTAKTYRWQEDWSALADPNVPRERFDELKYIALGEGSYLSLGLNVRERFETNHASDFGIGSDADSWLIQRIQAHAALHLGEHVQIFTQLEDARAFGKSDTGPADENKLDLRQAFVALTGSVGGSAVKVKIGRQEIGFDLQRFISSRDGPNVRQAFDAVWLDWEHGAWRFIGFASQPVQYRDAHPFDDVSNGRFRFALARIENNRVGPGSLSVYYARYDLDGARFPAASGDERRDIVDGRYAGKTTAADWDLEAMLQRGHVGRSSVRAWAIGARVGYTLAVVPLKPRLGVQFDAASGDRHPGDTKLGTFNPLFPNGYYFTLAGFTGYSNLIHVKPSITFHPTERLTVMTAGGLQWRMTRADAVFTQPVRPIAGTAGRGSHWTGGYAQLRADWGINRLLTASVEAVHYEIGNTLRAAGGHDGDYLGIELKFGW